MRYLPMHLRPSGVCSICRRAIVFDGKRWKDSNRVRAAHACPTARPTCGALMPGSGRGPERRLKARWDLERCARRPGHLDHHRSRWAMDNELYAQRGHRLASGATKPHAVRVGVSDTPPHETARLPLTPVVAGPSHPRVESARRAH